jgi:signal transduction histidine kinase
MICGRLYLLPAQRCANAQWCFGPVSDTWKEVLEEYRQSNENLLKLVETLLDVSRYEVGGGKHLSYEALNWQIIFNQATTQINASWQRQCAFSFNIAPNLPIIYGDPLEIGRVLQNLLDNAVRVSEPNQEISLEVVAFGTNQVRVSVGDKGPGIAPQEKERLFHRFIQGEGGAVVQVWGCICVAKLWKRTGVRLILKVLPV